MKNEIENFQGSDMNSNKNSNTEKNLDKTKEQNFKDAAHSSNILGNIGAHGDELQKDFSNLSRLSDYIRGLCK